ncbi:MAG: protein kinase [Planctomycetota bacterium]
MNGSIDSPYERTLIAGRYKVIRKIGAGGMGEVYLVEDPAHPGTPVALKIIKGGFFRSGVIDAFKNEFKILVKLRHPNVAQAYEFGQTPDTSEHFFTAEFVDGVSISDAVQPDEIDRILELSVQILRGLAFVHSRGLVHHDIKASNLLVCRTDSGGSESALAKIIDFGLVASERQATDVLMGSPSYIAPERIRRQAADRRADLYSFGIVLYRLLTGRLPYRGETLMALLERHLRDPVPIPSRARPDVPPALDVIVTRLLEKSPSDRYDSAAEVIEALNEGLGRTFPLETTFSREGYIASSAFVGRSAAIDLLARNVSRVLSPYRIQGQNPPEAVAFLILGERGIGKTRLLEEVRVRLELQDAAVFTQACPPEDRLSSVLLSRIVRWLQQRARLANVPLNAADARVLPEGIVPWTSVTEGADCLERLMLSISERSPVALVLDNLECASEGTWEVLSTLAERRNRAVRQPDRADFDPIFLFGAALSVLLPAGKEGLRLRRPHPSASAFHVLELEPLKALEVRHLLRGMFGSSYIPDSVLSRLQSFSQGNPALLHEAIRTLAEKGHLRRQGDLWICTRVFSPGDLPTGLVEMLLPRSDSLSPEGRSALRTVALFAAPCPQAAFEALAEPGARIAEARQVGLVLADPNGDLTLAHPRLRDAILAGMDAATRASLHRAALEWIESRDPRADEAKALERIEQAAGAGLAERAAVEGPPVAANLLAKGDAAGASRLWERIFSCLPPGDARRSNAAAEAARAAETANLRDGARRWWREVLQISAPAAPASLLAEAHERAGRFALEEGRIDSADRHAGEARRLGTSLPEASLAPILELAAQVRRRRGDLLVCASLLESPAGAAGTPSGRRLLADIRALSGKTQEAAILAEAAEEAAKKGGDARAEGRSAVLLARIQASAGLYAEAVIAARRARTIAESIPDTGLLVDALLVLARVSLSQGRLREAMDRAQRIGTLGSFAAVEARRIRAGALLRQVEPEAAWALLLEAQPIARATGDFFLLHELLVDLFETVRSLGLRAEALSGVRRTLGEIRGRGVLALESRSRLLEAALLADDDPESAGEPLREAERLARASDSGLFLGAALLASADGDLDRGDSAAARARVAEASALPAVAESVEFSARIDIARAEIAILEGRPKDALSDSARARKAAADEELRALALRALYASTLAAKAARDEASERAAKIDLRALLEQISKRSRPSAWRELHQGLQKRYERIKSRLLA